MKNTAILSFFIFSFTCFYGQESNKSLKGKFILKGSECAGFTFVDSKSVLWTNEISCNDPDPLKIIWIDKSNFITRTADKKKKDCPPKVSFYHIESFNGTKLILKETWTGWGDYKDEILEFTKEL